MLHSSFWHHGASDLGLPLLWAPSLTHGCSGDDVDENTHAYCRGQRSYDGPGLDFLYPAKTLALIHRISMYGWETVGARRKQQLNGNGIRQFSTTRCEARRAHSDDLGLKELSLRAELQEKLQGASASDALRELLDSKDINKQELAWRLYSAITERNRTPTIRADLLEYLTSPGILVDANRILRIFNTLPLENRRASSYRAAISAYLMLEMVGPAVQLHEEAAGRSVEVDFGTNLVLGHTIQDNQWDLTLRVFNTCKQYWIREQPKRPMKKSIWNIVAELPRLSDKATSLLQYVRQFHHELHASEEKMRSLRSFMAGFIPQVIAQTLSVGDPDDDYIWSFFTQFFPELRTVGLCTSDFYEFAIGRMLDLPRYREYSNQRKLVLALYMELREESMRNPDPQFRPSQGCIQTLIRHLGAKGSFVKPSEWMTSVSTLVGDWHTFHGQLPEYLLFRLMHLYAKAGEANKVHDYFEELREKAKDRIELRHLSQLLHVYAQRIDVQGALHQFRRISEEFRMEPDIVCWNILLRAYVRADELDAALECFNNILNSGLQPDKHTFGPLLDLCARRGDVEAFEGLFSKAAQLKVPIRNETAARAGYVLACLNMNDTEGAEAVAEGMLKDHRAGTLRGPLTPTWNMLITHYALRRDVGSSQRVYRQMMKNNIPLDTWTYAALMRALVELHQTNAAYKILRLTMPNNNVQVHAFHYALVITGFIAERQYEHALRAHNRMISRGVKQTISSRIASLQAIGLTELRKLKEAGNKNPLTRVVAVEETLRQILLESDGSELAIAQPRHTGFYGSPQQFAPEGYFEFLILLYSTRGAYEVCKELFEAASVGKEDQAGNYEPPIGLLTAIMSAHLRAREFKEIEKCWDLARAQADQFVKTWDQANKGPGTLKIEFDSLIDSSFQSSIATKKLAMNRRQILYKAARIYIRSLLLQRDPASLQKAQKTISNLLMNGFIIDNLTWNEFIQMLAQRGRLVDSFTACEAYLMPNFPGWRKLHPFYRRKDQRGHAYMELRHYDMSGRAILPRYRTLVILAAAYGQVKREEANGVGYNPEFGGWSREVLEKIAPKTVHAIETMPRVAGDKLQMKYVMGM
ncbi:hypothetical protein K469DRAFT_709802 [Zopfia rhizophila CBS 207.26]|uniref:TPR-like protein n=1 Tax=Zopfia rhizophila CBS 207.26 TaxID=1314779 RepID=A0A6A6EW15_9PEZI|nr:hypothetical protein K469DRAFT_709802 [Zopfia rhizophila CBS 207.26]